MSPTSQYSAICSTTTYSMPQTTLLAKASLSVVDSSLLHRHGRTTNAVLIDIYIYLTDSPLLFVQTHVFCANKSHTTKWQVYFSFQFFYVVAWRFHNYEALKIFGTKPKTHEDRFLHGNLLAVISEQHTHGRILSKRNNLFRTRFKDPCIENVFE